MKFKSNKFKHGAYAIGVTVIAVIAVILFNIAGSALAEKVNLKSDLSANSDFTLSQDVVTYLDNDVKDNITITVCCDKDDYTNGILYQVLKSFSYGDSSDGVFLKQTVYLLEEIDRKSDNITVNFVDPLDPSFAQYTTKYPELTITFGDILVEAEFVGEDGKTYTRQKLLAINDIYNVVNVAEQYGESYVYAYECNYLIAGNKLETAICSAIYTVTSDKTYKVALLTANGGSKIDNLQNLMTSNNYEFTEIDNLYETENAIPEDTDIIIISAPTNDYKPKELELIDNYLSSDNSKFRTVLYIASATQPSLPNINAFISEWGFIVEPNVVLAETDSSYIRNNENTCIEFVKQAIPDKAVDETDYDKYLPVSVDYNYISSNNAVISMKNNVSNSRYTRTILASSPASAPKSFDADDNWTPEKTTSYVSLGVGFTYHISDEYEQYEKRVFVLNSLDFITNSFNSYEECGNLNILLSALDVACGKNVNSVVFDTRTFETETFETPTDMAVNIMMIIFVVIIPLAVLICCIVVMIKRRHL